MIETMDGFAERTLRSQKKIFHRYMEVCGGSYIQKLSQFVTTQLPEKKVLIRHDTKVCWELRNFLSILYSKPIRNYKNPKLKLETKFASRWSSSFSQSVTSHNIQRSFGNCIIFFQQVSNIHNTQKRMSRMKVSVVNVMWRSWSKSFNIGFV